MRVMRKAGWWCFVVLGCVAQLGTSLLFLYTMWLNGGLLAFLDIVLYFEVAVAMIQTTDFWGLMLLFIFCCCWMSVLEEKEDTA